MNFNCYETIDLNLGETRYNTVKNEDTDVIGVDHWQGAGHKGDIIKEWDHEKRVSERHKMINPRIFISHRQSDGPLALNFANYLKSKNIAYWLDICDPRLTKGPNLSAIGIANIIEIALINCTHVVAIITKNSKGSLWIPYEYGRIKDPRSYIGNVCAFYNIPQGDLPEYMLLSAHEDQQQDVLAWIIKNK